MHSSTPQPNDTGCSDNAAPSDADAQECLLYLFGELDAEHSLRFEQSLENDAELRQRFVQQAHLVALLGEAAPASSPRSVAAATIHSPTGNLTKRTRFSRSGRSIGWIASIAASILLVSWLARPGGESASTSVSQRAQTQRLADAWWLSYGSVDTSEVLEDRLVDEIDELDEIESAVAVVDEQPALDELPAPPDWMISALSALRTDGRSVGEVSGG